MTTWKIDPSHSEVNFKVKHLVVSTVSGQFKSFNAEITSGMDDFSDASVNFEADAASIDTKNEQRDGHLKSYDFFDAAHHPKITFESTSVKKTGKDELKVTGNLSIRGITKPVTLDVIYNGTVSGFGGTNVAGFEIRGKINRFDYGLQWNALTEAGGIVVSEDVRIEILAEFIKAEQSTKAA